MKHRVWSLRTAVMLPIVIITFLVLIVSVYFSARDYDFLAKEQGSKILDALYENTEMRLSTLLMDSQDVNSFYEYYIANTGMYDYDTMYDIERFTLEFMKQAQADTPQISAMSYGDEKGNFAGYRHNDDQSYGLMLKDTRTDFNLNIYAGENQKSELLASFEEYDPTTRPWYAPVKKNRQVQWSEVYVNYDEKMELTITSLVPVFDKFNVFRGVAGADVKLNMINDFLLDEEMKGNGVIYIVDSDFNIIAHSIDADYVKIMETDPPTAVMLPAYEAENQMIQMSAKHIQEKETASGEVEQIMIDNARYFSMYSPLKSPAALNWSIVAVIPESDLMGAVKHRQDTTFQFTAVILVFSMFLAMYALSRVTKPILESSEAALKLSGGDFDTKLEIGNVQLFETRELVMAFNNMAEKLQSSFTKLQESEEKYRTLIENVDNMIYSISTDGKFISMNNSFASAMPYSKDYMIGKPYEIIIEDHKMRRICDESFNNVLKTNTKQDFQYEYLDLSGDRKIQSVKLVPQFDENGNLASILGASTDITDLVLAQERIQSLLKAEKQELESMVRERTEELEATMQELIDRERLASLGSLVAGIAHEVNTPLGVAVTAGSYMDKINTTMFKKLREGKLSKKDLTEYMKSIDESAEIINTNLGRASELIRSFKEISVNQSVENITDFKVADTIHDVLLALKHEYKNTKHTFEIDCDEALQIRSYPGALSQILTNLIMNSLIHGFEQVEEGHIHIRAYREDDTFIFDYWDDGAGISDENLSRIFDPFFTTNRKRGGSGLGLNIVYNIVTGKLNGKIQCISEEGKGTSFVIRTPLEK